MDNALSTLKKLHKYHRYDIKSSYSEKFSDQFNAIVRENRRIFRRHIVNNPSTAWRVEDSNGQNISFEHEDIPCVDISMPLDQYAILIEKVNTYHVMASAYKESAKLLEAYEQAACEEQIIRDRHPVVKKAYEKYLIMFNLMRNDYE